MARRVLAVRWALTNRGTLEVKALIVRTKALMVRKVLTKVGILAVFWSF